MTSRNEIIELEDHDMYEWEMKRREHRLIDAVNAPTPDEDRSVEQHLTDLGYLDQ